MGIRKEKKLPEGWEKIDGHKKFVVCRACGKRVQTDSVAKMYCDKCHDNMY